MIGMIGIIDMELIITFTQTAINTKTNNPSRLYNVNFNTYTILRNIPL